MMGSPPRARGEAAGGVGFGLTGRITPACAGRSRQDGKKILQRQDHPRVRGEKEAAPNIRDPYTGSPPRARGEGAVCDCSGNRGRITPACAGRSPVFFGGQSGRTDHPRVRGEKPETGHVLRYIPGSPPRARGEVNHSIEIGTNARITPACAGRSAARPASVFRAPDHPRVRGEKPFILDLVAERDGSPPRARGEGPWKCTAPSRCGSPPRARGEALMVQIVQHNE